MGNSVDGGYGLKWLELNGVPEMEDIEERLTVLNEQIDLLMHHPANDTAILYLQRNFELSDLEISILATLVIAMNEEAIMRLMCVALADFTVRLPTVSFIANLLGDTPDLFKVIKDALGEQGSLRLLGLVQAEPNSCFPRKSPQVFTPLSVDQEVIDAFCGYNRELPSNVIIHNDGLPIEDLICEADTIKAIKDNSGIRPSSLYRAIHVGIQPAIPLRQFAADAFCGASRNGQNPVGQCHSQRTRTCTLSRGFIPYRR